MSKGKVKWFSNARGYGFILGEETDKDIFVHHTSIQMDGYRTLKEGDPVTFDLVDGPKGPKAENVARLVPRSGKEAPEAKAAAPAEAPPTADAETDGQAPPPGA